MSSLAVPAQQAGRTTAADALAREMRSWAGRVRAGQGSAVALEHLDVGRLPQALEQAGRDGDPVGEGLIRARILLGEGHTRGLAEVADRLEGRVESLLLAWLRYLEGVDLMGMGQAREAEALLTRALADFRRQGTPLDQADALKKQAGARLLAGRLAGSVEAYREAADLYRDHGRPEERALAQGMQARALGETGRYAEAVRLYRESLPVLEQAGWL